eukprot:6070621-Pyramimonas_sp.AAC.1
MTKGPLDWYYHIWPPVGRCRACRGAHAAWRRRRTHYGPPLGPCRQCFFPRIRSRGTHLDRRGHRHRDPIPIGRSTTAWSGR